MLPRLMADQELHSTPIHTTKPCGSHARIDIAAILGPGRFRSCAKLPTSAPQKIPENQTLSSLYLQSIAARTKFMNTVSVA